MNYAGHVWTAQEVQSNLVDTHTTSCIARPPWPRQPATVRGFKSDRMLTRMMMRDTVLVETLFFLRSMYNERDFTLAVSVSYCVHFLTLFLPHFCSSFMRIQRERATESIHSHEKLILLDVTSSRSDVEATYNRFRFCIWSCVIDKKTGEICVSVVANVRAWSN